MIAARLAVSLLALGAGVLPVAGWGADYPSKPIRLLIPYTPGGNADVLGRTIGQHLGTAWKVPVVVENKPGASGTLAVDTVAKAAPDGYTVVLGVFGNILVAKSLYKRLPYDPEKDLAPFSLVATPPTVLVANTDFGPSTVGELLAYARKNAGKVFYASSGKGTSNHLFGELLASLSGVELKHIPYKGMGPALNDVVGGRVQLAFAPFPLALPQIKAGRLKALGVTGASRSEVLPGVPTIAEQGVAGYEGSGWFALMAPAGVPPAILQKLNAEVDRILKRPDIRNSLAAEGATPVGGDIAVVERSMQEGIRKWGPLARAVAGSED